MIDKLAGLGLSPARLTPGAAGLMTFVSFFWAMGIVGSKVALRILPPFLFGGTRFLLAGLLVFLVIRLLHQKLPASGREWAFIAGLGLIHTTGLYAVLYHGLALIASGKAIVILNSQPFWVALFAPVFLGELKFSRVKVVGLSVGFLGVLIVFARDVVELNLNDLKGGGLVMAAALFWTAGTLYAKRVVSAGSVFVAQAIQSSMGSVPLLLLGWAVEGPGKVVVNYQSVSLVVGLAIFCTCLPYLLWFRLLRNYPSGLLSSFNFLQIVFAVVVAYFLLGEPLKPSLMAGAVLVSAGIFIVNRMG